VLTKSNLLGADLYSVEQDNRSEHNGVWRLSIHLISHTSHTNAATKPPCKRFKLQVPSRVSHERTVLRTTHHHHVQPSNQSRVVRVAAFEQQPICRRHRWYRRRKRGRCVVLCRWRFLPRCTTKKTERQEEDKNPLTEQRGVLSRRPVRLETVNTVIVVWSENDK